MGCLSDLVNPVPKDERVYFSQLVRDHQAEVWLLDSLTFIYNIDVYGIFNRYVSKEDGDILITALEELNKKAKKHGTDSEETESTRS